LIEGKNLILEEIKKIYALNKKNQDLRIFIDFYNEFLSNLGFDEKLF
jgi:hypothetical protein